MRNKCLLFSLAILFLSAELISNVYATSGSTPIGFGTVSAGMGGTGVAYPTDALTSATNPAGIVYLGKRGDIGIMFFGPLRGYSATTGVGPFRVAPGTHNSGATLFVIPDGGYASPFSDPRGAWSISMYANGGVNTSYTGFGGSTIGIHDGVYGGGKAKADLVQLFNNVSFAWKFNQYLAVGASVILAHQLFEAKGFAPFAPFSTNPRRLTNQGLNYSFGAGGTVGVLSHLANFLAIGASYQPEIPMTDLSNYAGLLPGVSGAFNIPPRGTIGLALTPGTHLDVNFDYQHIWYSAVPAYSNPFKCTTITPCLGFKGASGLGWADANVYKVGLQWFVNPLWTLRVGYAHSSEVVRPSQVLFDIIAPGTLKDHFTAGLTRYVGTHMAFNLALMYAPNVEVTGPNPFNPSQIITVNMHQYYVGFSWSWV